MNREALIEDVLDKVAGTMLIGPWRFHSIWRDLRELIPGRHSLTQHVVQFAFWQFRKKPKVAALRKHLAKHGDLVAVIREDRKIQRAVARWEVVARELADALLQVEPPSSDVSGAPSEVSWHDATHVERTLAQLVGRRQAWMAKLAKELVATCAANVEAESLAAVVAVSDVFRSAFQRFDSVRQLANRSRVGQMRPCGVAPRSWRVPEIVSPQQLADWLALPLSRLLWLANGTAEFRSSAAAQHYRYRWSPKRSRGYRLIEAPKPALKSVQQDILHGILNRIPGDGSSHGFQSGRNIKTYCAPHIDSAMVLRLDLKDFYVSVQRKRVQAIFRTAGYPEAVVQLLSQLCTNCTPRSVIALSPALGARTTDENAFRASHLPQGAPTSPALANLSAYRLDRRMSGLAAKFCANYTRYADDLLFSGEADFARQAKRFHVLALAIALDEGFQIQPRKTRMMRRGVRQTAGGLVVNDKVNTSRREYERLKATLHNCKKFGPESQNRQGHADFEAHLRGLVSFHAHINPARGQSLLRAFQDAFSGSDETP